MSILIEDIKSWFVHNKKDLFYIVICALVGLSCFAIGKLYSKQETKAPIIIQNCPVGTTQAR